MHLRALSCAAATALSLVLAGCGGAEPPAPPPPPPPESTDRSAPVELAGAPERPAEPEGLAGGTPVGAQAMAPIPNPEDLPPAERRRIYGAAFDDPAPPAPRHTRVPPRAEAPARPAPARPSPRREPASKRPVAVVPLETRLAQLQAAVAPQVSAAAALTVGADLTDGQAAPVVLTLPPMVYDAIRREAAKLSLGRAARIIEVNAALSGQGYAITPNSPQTARLKSGEATSFQWQVAPGAGPPAPLHVEIGATLRGQRETIVLPLAPIDRTVASPKGPETARRGLFNWGHVDVPGVGRMRWETVIGGVLLLLALVLLVAIARNASEAEARARRQRQRAAEDPAAAPAPQEGAPPAPAAPPTDETKTP